MRENDRVINFPLSINYYSNIFTMKMKYLNLIFVLAAGVMLLSSCGATRQANQLLEHNQILTALAGDATVTPEEKLDVLMTSMTGMMHEGMRIVNPKKGVNYVTQFGSQNSKAIDQILREVGTWQKDMGSVERIALGARMLQKPYAKDALDLIPKFVRKYQQVTFVTRTTKKLKSNLIGLGKSKLGGLGDILR